MTTQLPKNTAPNSLGWNIAAGAIFGIAALIAAPLAGLELSGLSNDEGQVSWLTVFTGVFVTGWCFWWLVMSRPQLFSPWRGAVTGIVVALFSYPAVLLLAEIFQRNWHVTTAGTILARLLYVLAMTGLSLLTTGFAATLIMAVAGALMAVALVRLDPKTATSSAREAHRRRSGLMRGLFKALAILAPAIVLLLVGAFAWLSLTPLRPIDLVQSQPATTYDEALAAFEVVTAKEAAMPLHPRCHSTLLTHGRKTVRVVIYFHGLTNCPAQADELASRLYDLGYNVYIPRLPGHGEADPLTLALADMTTEDLAGTAQASVDMAQGLGDEVVVIGLSAGGTMAAWLAQSRADVGDVIPAAPFLGPHMVPPWANHAATNLLLMLPNMMIWWNPSDPTGDPEMDYAYPRYATHALAQVLRLGSIVEAEARDSQPKAQRIGMLLNAADFTVSNALVQKVIASWRGHGKEVSVQTLPLERGLPHDLIDPRQPDADVDFVYSVLLGMIANRASP